MDDYILLYRGNELEHHGVLGMKWGVWNEETRARHRDRIIERRAAVEEASKTPIGRARIASNTKEFGKGGAARIEHAISKGVDPDVAAYREHKRRNKILAAAGIGIAAAGIATAYLLDDKARSRDVVLEKGQHFERVTTNPDEREEGSAFFSYLAEDSKQYAKNADLILGLVDQTYGLKYEAAEKIVSPSIKKRVNTMIETFNQDPAFKQRLETYLRDRGVADERLKYLSNPAKKKGTSQRMAFDLFNLGIASDRTLRDTYQTRLQAKGYNAVIDDNDRRKGLAQAPIIIFDRASSLRQVAKQEYARGNERAIDRVIDQAIRDSDIKSTRANRIASLHRKDLLTRAIHSDAGGVDV